MKRYPWPVSLQELRPSHVIEFRGWLLRHCAGRHQAMKVLSTFHSVVREMFLRDIVSQNVVRGITITMSSRHRKEIVPPTEKELFALLAAADQLANVKDQRIAKHWQRYRPILYLAADTGARPQEYLALATYNIGSDAIKIDRAIERGNYRLNSTKTAAGRRWIDISPDVRDMVNHFIDTHAVSNPYDLAFPGENGRWQDPGHWRKRGFHKACEIAGLMVSEEADGRIIQRPKYSPYDLRHFYASMLIDQGTNLKRIQKLLGHEDIKTTLNHYGHLIDRAEAKREQTSGLIGTLRQNLCGTDVAQDCK
ncbi:MAG: site-specific integrase [Pseudomonadota bacterium]